VRRQTVRFVYHNVVDTAPVRAVLRAVERRVPAPTIERSARSIPLDRLPPSLDGLAVLHVSDLHLGPQGPHVEPLAEAIDAQSCDLVAFTGDFIDGDDGIPFVHDLLGSLTTGAPMFAVLGNHDHWALARESKANDVRALVGVLRDHGVRVLHNESVAALGGRLTIAGVDDPATGRDDLSAAMAGVPPDEPVVLLAHSPEIVRRLRDPRPMLILAGHTHGGQLRLPGIGPVFNVGGVPRRMAMGHHEVAGGVQLHVSRGVGYSGAHIRFRCPPEVTRITLRSTEPPGAADDVDVGIDDDDEEPTRLCTIGVPAYNEELAVGACLSSLLSQRRLPGWVHHVHLLANGCTDATVERSLDVGRAHFGAEPSPVAADHPVWRFDAPRLSLSVHDLPKPSKTAAINVAHAEPGAEIVVLVDADARAGPGLVAGMVRALDEDPSLTAVAPTVQGDVAALDTRRGVAREAARVLVSHAINEFDLRTPRLDGRAYGYRREAVDEHPPIVAVDTWMEGVAAAAGGCRYLDDVRGHYALPATFADLVSQYRRYERTGRDLAAAHPELLNHVRASRARARDGNATPPKVWARVVGWTFFAAVRARPGTATYRDDTPWDVIASTKRV
jgi:predicted MPP superfamily phosphohydrolase